MTSAAINLFGASNLFSGGRRKVGFIGDSITAGGDTYFPDLSSGENSSAPALYAMLASTKNSWDLMQNAGIAGQNSTQILGRIQPEIINIGCDICVIYSTMWNDIGGSFPINRTMNNITQMLQLCLRNNVLPILCTPTPDAVTGGSASRKQQAALIRRNIIELARSFNIPCFDLFAILGNVTTGALLAAYDAGDIHPNDAGRQAAGAALGTMIDSLCYGNAANGVEYAGDTTDILSGNGYFLTNSGGIGTGFSLNSGAVATPSIFVDGTLGNMQRITTAASGSNYDLATAALPIALGHVLEISGYISKNGSSQGQLSINPNVGGVRRLTIIGAAPTITKGHFCIRWVPPQGATITVHLVVGAGTGTVDYGRLTIRDLTAIGIA